MAGDPALDRSISPKKRPRYEQPVKSLEFLKKENAQRSFLRTKVCPDDLSRMIQTQKVFSLYNPPTESFPCARTIPYAGCARARFWKWNKKSMTTQKIEKVTEPVKKVDMVHRSYQQWLPNLWKIRKRVSEYIVEGMMKETNRQSRLDTHRMSKQYRTDTRASPIPSVMRKPYDALGDSEPRTAKTRDMRVAVGSEVVSLEISGPEQGIDVDWNTVWLEEMVVQDRAFTEDESSSDSQSTSMAMEEVSAEDVSQDSLHPKNESNRTSVFSQSNITAALMKPHEEEKQPRLRPLDLSDRLSKSKQKLQQETGVASCRVRGERRKTASVNPKPNPLLFSVMMGFPPNEPVPRVIATPTTLPQCASPLDTLAFAACSAAASEANSAAPSPAIQTENLGEVIEKALRISPPTGASLQQQLGLLTIAKDKRSTEEANGDRNRRNSIEKQSRGSVVGPSRQYSKLVPAPLPSQKLRRVSEKAEGAVQKTVSRSVTSVSKSSPGINQVSLEATRSKFQELIQKRKNLEPAKKLAKPPVSTLGLLQPTDWFAQYGLEAEYSPPPNETDAPVKTLLSKSVMSPRTAQNRTQDKKETRAFERDHPVSSNLSPRKMDQGGSSRGALRITISPERLGSSRKLIPSSEEMLSPSRRPIVYRTLTPEEKRSPNPLSLVQKKMGSEEWYDATAVQDTLTVKTSPGDLKTPKKVSSGPLDRQHLEPLKGSKQRILPAGTVTQRINLEEFPTVSAKKRGRPRKYPLAPVEQESLDKQNTEAVQKMKSSVTEPDLSPVLAPQIKIFVAAEEEKHLPLKKRKVSYSTDPEQEISQPSPKKGRGRPPKTASRLENVPEALEKRKTRSPEKALMESTTVGSTAAGNSPSLEQSLRGRRRSGRKADMESSEKMRRYGSRNKTEEADMSAPADTERSDAGNWSSTAGPSRESSVADDSASEKTSFSSSYANMKTENKYMMAPKKYLLRRAQTEQADEPVPEQTPPLPDPVAHPEVFRQPSLDDIHLLTPPPVETSPDIMILEPPEKTPEEVKREAEESFEEPVPFQVTDYEYDEDGVDDPPIGAPVIYACDFSVIDKGQGLNLDWAPFPPDSARVDATCFSHLVLNLARGQKFSILPRMTNRYSLIREEYDLLMFIIEDAEVNPMYLKGDNYTLACEDPRALFEQAVVDLSGPCLQLLTRDKDPVVAKKQVLTSYKIREVIDVFLKKKNELLIGLATEAFGNTDGPEFQLLKEQFELVMKAIQIRMCDSLMGLAEETKQWDPTVNTLKRRFETFLFGWRSFIHQGGAIKCFYERFKDEMHPRVAETTNKCISITETYTRKIASFLQEGPVARVNQLVENFEKDRKVFTDKFPRSITNVETTRSASHRHGCKDPCNIFFSEVDLLDYHKELHKYKPYDCNICYLSFSHELSLYLHYLERHTIDVLTRDIRIAS